MKYTWNEKFVAYLALISGLSISTVAVYYSVIGLTSIFSAAAIPIIIMGVTLEVSKIIATVWLKQNWDYCPRTIKAYLISAVVVLMLITSMGIFGFLSKAHSDQNLVSGDVLSKIAIYDEKIKIAKENIDANRRALKQLDEAVDQVMGRSTTESGAERSVQIRRQQGPERQRLIREIEAEQKKISEFNEARAPIAAEVRKVEAEVGPIKYIANFFYGETDPTILEKAVTWVILIIVLVFDPLAVVLLLAAQTSFQEFRRRELETKELLEPTSSALILDVGKKQTEEEMKPEQEEQKEKLDDLKIPSIIVPIDTKETEPPNKIDQEPVEEVKAPKPLRELVNNKVVRTKVFPKRQTSPKNEENNSQLTVIDSKEYTKTVLSKKEQEIINYANLVRSNLIQISDVPEEYQARVQSLV